jgi:hypothetical protein
MKLNTGAFALAFGIWWGVGVFVATWWLIIAGVESTGPMFLEHFYIGYGVTPLGSLLGLIWGFVCGTICGGILSWLYNTLSERISAETWALTN